MTDFIILNGAYGETILVNRLEISTITQNKESDKTSTLIMKNGTEYEIEGTVNQLLMNYIGTKQI